MEESDLGVKGVDYEKVINNGGLWYSYKEGKVRREWVREICKNAGLSADDMEEGVWYIVPYKKEKS